MATAAELHKKSDPGAEQMLRIILKEFCMDARYSGNLTRPQQDRLCLTATMVETF